MNEGAILRNIFQKACIKKSFQELLSEEAEMEEIMVEDKKKIPLRIFLVSKYTKILQYKKDSDNHRLMDKIY